MVWEEEFGLRLAHLRMEKGVSARDMSLSIGQCAGYINNIENGKNFPSMAVFFFICEYLGVTPAEFFDIDADNPETLHTILDDLKTLKSNQLEHIAAIVHDLKR